MLGLIPIKDWAYLGIILALVIGFGVFVHHERVIGEQKIEAADKAATAREVAAAASRNAAIAADYQTKLKDTENAYQATLATAVDRADELTISLRQYAARNRCLHALPAGPAAPSKPDGPAPVAGSDAGVAAATQRLLDAAAADAAELSALQAERKSLTGK